MAKRRVRENPDLDTTDLTEKVVPGFGAYAATRFLSRTAYSMAEKKQSKHARHVAVGVGLATAGLAWAFGDRVKQTQKYAEPILIGAGAAALQTLVQAYMPKYGWMVGDLPSGAQRAAMAAQSQGPSLDDLLKDDDYEAVPLLLPGQPPPAGTVTQSMKRAAAEEELISELSDYSDANDTSY